MENKTWIDAVISFLLWPFKYRPKEMEVKVLKDGSWGKCKVSNPTSFSELDEQFGEGNWKL